jgi:hypothetical protein
MEKLLSVTHEEETPTYKEKSCLVPPIVREPVHVPLVVYELSLFTCTDAVTLLLFALVPLLVLLHVICPNKCPCCPKLIVPLAIY